MIEYPITIGIAAIITQIVLFYHIEKNSINSISSFISYIFVWIGWLNCFSTPLILSVDINNDFDDKSNILIWKYIYWTNFILSYIAIPLISEYLVSGAFTKLRKIKLSIKSQVKYYLYVSVILIIGIVYLIIIKKFNAKSFLGLLQGIGNLISMFLMIYLLGIGLIEIPRKFWYKGNYKLMLDYYHYRAFVVVDEYDDAYSSYVTLAHSINNIDDNNNYKEYVSMMKNNINTQKKNNKEDKKNKTYLDLEDLEKMNGNLKILDHQVRSSYSRLNKIVDRITEIECQTNYFKNYMYKFLSIIMIFMSIFILLCEATIGINKFSFMSNVIKYKPIILIPIFIGYISYCIYSTLFQIESFKMYKLTHKHSSLYSLLFMTSIMMILSPAICYNFLFLLHKSSNTAFGMVLGDIHRLPFIGNIFNTYFPIFIVIICIMTFFNIDQSIIKILKFQIPTDYEDINIGKKEVNIIQNKRSNNSVYDAFGNSLFFNKDNLTDNSIKNISSHNIINLDNTELV